MKTAQQLLTCDVCHKPITKLDLAMVFIDAEVGKRVTGLRVAHKMSCDTVQNAKTYELLAFGDRETGLELLVEIMDALGLDASQLERLVHVAYAVPLLVQEQAKKSVS